MNYKINNTLFERKHHYVTILKESELLKQQMNEEVLDGAITASRLDEINHICNLAFAGLLQEGLEFRYSRDTNAAKESLIMTIDHVDYRCRVNALRNILHEKLDEFLNKSAKEQSPESVSSAKPDHFETAHDVYSAAQDEKLFQSERPSNNADRNPRERERRPENRFRFSSFGNSEEEANFVHPEDAALELPVNEVIPDDSVEGDISAESEMENALLASLLKNFLSGEEAVEDTEEEIEETENESAPLPSELQQEILPPAPEVAVIEEDKDEWYVEMEEKEKHKDTFCYETHRVAVSYEASGGAKEEIFFMIAPCNIERLRPDETRPSVPIVVYAYYNGRNYYTGSFKNGPDKNLVQIDVGDYQFLIRGMFKERKFESYIFTTGRSESQGVVLNTLEKKSFNPAPAKVRNGHLRFNYEGKDGEKCTVEVFPVNEGDNNFIVMHKIEHPTNGKFEYQYCTEDNKKILFRTTEGTRELVCWWDNDTVKAEIVPT